MAEASNKKRKRTSESASHKVKKVAFKEPPATTKIISVVRPSNLPPVIAVSPGIEVPSDVNFHSYQSRTQTRLKGKHRNDAVHRELLLHSSAHPSMDYTAKADDSFTESKPLLNHYIAIYDPSSGRIQVVEAKKMVVRAAVRSKQAPTTMKDQDVKQSMMEQRTDLGQTFGTKKAKKIIQERVLNAISPQKKPGEKNTPTTMDDASRAMLASVGGVTSTMATREELQAVVDEAKPVPPANVDADEIQDVYDPAVIIGQDILNLVPIREWQEKVRHKEGVETASQFVATRVNAIAANDDEVSRLRVLRYLDFVVTFYLHTKPGRERGTRRLPPREKIREFLPNAPDAVIENIRRKFSDAGIMRKFHCDLLATHCCVFAAIVDNYEIDTAHLMRDLRLDQRSMNQYFYEIGARVKPVKMETRTAHIARLKLPLDFPKQRQMAQRKR